MQPTTVTIPSPSGTYYLTGWREPAHDRARFDLALDDDAARAAILHNADWPTAWAKLVSLMKAHHVEATMRAALEASRPA